MSEQNSTAHVNSSIRWDISILLMLFISGILLRILLIAPNGFDGLYGQDPYAYYDFASELRTSLTEGRAPGAFFWPLGYPALLAAAHAIFGTQPSTGQAISILMGAALAPLVYIFARQLGTGRLGALIAGILMGICGQALQSSVVIMADIPALFWAMVSVVILWRYIRNPDQTPAIPSIFLSALILALACITRWLYLILAVPWALALLMVWKGRIRWRASLFGIVAALLIFVPQLLYSRNDPYPVLNHAWVEGWSPANVFRQVFDNVDGHFEYEKINGVYYAQPFYDAYYLAPIFTLFLLIGLVALFRDKRYAALLMLLGWGLLPYFFLAGIPYQNIRFPLIVFPAVAILAGVGLERTAGWVSCLTRPSIAYIALFALMIFGASQTLSASTSLIDTFITNQQRDKQSAAWTGEHVPSGATLYTFGLTLTLKHYTTLNVYEIFYETPDTLNQKWTHGQNDYLLLNVWNIENQWAGRDPQADYHWLRDKRGLVEIGKFGYYTLFRING
ncbi:MAG: phospholipid carrier-dependent glycosyltransferase [Chloroflexota bacterium]